MAKLIILNKPFHVLSQFTTEGDKKTLADYVPIKGVYPAGRLDFDSEGLLLLTDDGQLQAQISDPKYKLTKTYWAQVDGLATDDQCAELCDGVNLKDGPASALTCEILSAPDLWDRTPPIRVRQSSPTSWLKIVIAEGRNRQVRRMTAAINLPTLRLVRAQVGEWHIDGLKPGEYRSLEIEVAKSRARTFKSK